MAVPTGSLIRSLPVPAGRLVAAVVIVGLLGAMRLFVAEPMRVPSGSMQPTLRPGDHVILDKLAIAHRGDLVVFTSPNDGELLVKRLVATGGDEVGIADGELVVNGRTVDEPYVDHRLVDGVYFGPVTVPTGSIFVLGDNRTGSIDSRDFGPVPERSIVGRVVARAWPRPGRI